MPLAFFLYSKFLLSFFIVASGIYLSICFTFVFVLFFLFCFYWGFFFDKTQQGSGSQESAVERRLEPCAVVRVFRCASVHRSA